MYSVLHFYYILLHLTAGSLGIPFVNKPYSPSYVWTDGQSTAYVLSPNRAARRGMKLQSLGLSGTFHVDSPPLQELSDAGPPLAEDGTDAIVPVTDSDGFPLIYSGSCHSESREIWKFIPGENDYGQNGEWECIAVESVGRDKEGLKGPNFLASTVTFTHTNDGRKPDIFLFGGMCPADLSSEHDWVSGAIYSREMVILSADESSYELSTVSLRSGPVAEAGFTLTPLLPAYTNTSTGEQSVQQSFVLIGGHTQKEFVGTDVVGLLSLPETSWSYIAVEESVNLRARTKGAPFPFEPRSGHTAILSADGTKLFVVGGWVDDITNAAQPQVAVLRLEEGYGSKGPWTWDIPEQSEGLPDLHGIFGHGAALLPGGIMLVAGGYEIPRKSSARSDIPRLNERMFLFNTTSESWVTNYDLPSEFDRDSMENSGLLSSASQKAGLGVGIALGILALVTLALGLFCYRTRRSRQHRKTREQELRNLALGAERPQFFVPDHDFQQQMTERSTFIAPLGRGVGANDVDNNYEPAGLATGERTGLLVDTSSPTRPSNEGSRGYRPIGRFSTIHCIEEKEEYEQVPQDEPEHGGHRRSKSSTALDPFLDPPSPVKRSLAPPLLPELPLLSDNDAEGYSWLDNVLLGRRSASPGKRSRTLSNLSDVSGSGASVSTPGSRNQDQTRSHSPVAQYSTLELGESRCGPSRYNYEYTTGISPFPHKLAGGSSIMGQGPVWLTQPQSTLKTPTGPRSKALQWAGNVRRAIGSIRRSDISTRPHSVILEGATGYERSHSTTPTKSFHSALENMSSSGDSSSSSSQLPRRAMSTHSALMLGRKQGARDWDVGKHGAAGSTLLRSKTLAVSSAGYAGASGRSTGAYTAAGQYTYGMGYVDDDEDWDVEAAAEGRVVQFTFTVPKERLRVVNGGVEDETDDTNDDDDDDNKVPDRGKDETTTSSQERER